MASSSISEIMEVADKSDQDLPDYDDEEMALYESETQKARPKLAPLFMPRQPWKEGIVVDSQAPSHSPRSPTRMGEIEWGPETTDMLSPQPELATSSPQYEDMTISPWKWPIKTVLSAGKEIPFMPMEEGDRSKGWRTPMWATSQVQAHMDALKSATILDKSRKIPVIRGSPRDKSPSHSGRGTGPNSSNLVVIPMSEDSLGWEQRSAVGDHLEENSLGEVQNEAVGRYIPPGRRAKEYYPHTGWEALPYLPKHPIANCSECKETDNEHCLFCFAATAYGRAMKHPIGQDTMRRWKATDTDQEESSVTSSSSNNSVAISPDPLAAKVDEPIIPRDTERPPSEVRMDPRARGNSESWPSQGIPHIMTPDSGYGSTNQQEVEASLKTARDRKSVV
jgi:hypothetical protein